MSSQIVPGIPINCICSPFPAFLASVQPIHRDNSYAACMLVRSVAWSPDSLYLAASSWNGEVHIWGFGAQVIKYKAPSALSVACAWVLGVGMSLYGGLGLVSDMLHITGVIGDSVNGKWFFWYFVLWDPWWLLGGVLYLTTAWFARRIP